MIGVGRWALRPSCPRLLCYKPKRALGFGGGAFLKAQTTLRAFSISASTGRDIRRYRVDGQRLWEHREAGWFIHCSQYVPEHLVRVITRSDGREVPIYAPEHYERLATKQASKREIQTRCRCWKEIRSLEPAEDAAVPQAARRSVHSTRTVTSRACEHEKGVS